MKKNLSKISDPGESKLASLLKFIAFAFTKPGLGLIKKIAARSLRSSGISGTDEISYSEWIKTHTNSLPDTEATLKQLKLKPKISIVIPFCDPRIERLADAISSVISQSYDDWELLIAGTIPALPHNDERVKYISGESNTILSAASGAYILFMAQDDILAPGCLYELLKHINTYPQNQLIYTDEDAVDDAGNFSAPHFKPGWSPHSLLSRNYIGHTIVIKKGLLEQLNGFGDNGDYYDLLLRATELTKDIGHIPAVLYHCRAHDFSIADDILAKKALQGAMVRRNTPAIIDNIPGASGCYELTYEVKAKEKVSIIIPSKDNTELLKTALDSIFQKTDYPDYEIIVLNNNSSSAEFFQLMKVYSEQHPAKFRCIDAAFPFNFAKLMNLGVAQSNGTYILMCNNDIEVIHNDWMSRMVSYARHTETGAVGVKLLYPDDTIQHAGIVLGLEDAAGHVFVNKDRNDSGYFNSLKTATNYSAVTAACILCRKEVYNIAGGMDEQLAVEYNDIDFCLTLLKNGYYNVYLPSVELYHHESATRGHPFRSNASWKQHEMELGIFKKKWQHLIDNDPFYNPNLSRETAFRLRS